MIGDGGLAVSEAQSGAIMRCPRRISAMDRLSELKKQWEHWGRKDPMWAVLHRPDKRRGRWTEEEFFETGRREAARMIGVLTELNAWPIGGRTLDFGCGPGRLAQAFAPHFDEVIGVDISTTMIERAEAFNRYPDKVLYLVNDRPDLRRLEDESFDFVYSHLTLQHIQPHLGLAYLREMMRVLKRGGILAVQITPRPTKTLAGLVTGLIPYQVRRLAVGMEMHAYPEAVVREEFERGGMSVLKLLHDKAAGPRWVSQRYYARKS